MKVYVIQIFSVWIRVLSPTLYLSTDLFTFPSKSLLIDNDSDYRLLISDGDYICLQPQNFYHA